MKKIMEKTQALNNMFEYLLCIIREDEKQEVKSIEFIIESMADLSKEIEAENQKNIGKYNKNYKRIFKIIIILVEINL